MEDFPEDLLAIYDGIQRPSSCRYGNEAKRHDELRCVRAAGQAPPELDAAAAAAAAAAGPPPIPDSRVA